MGPQNSKNDSDRSRPRYLDRNFLGRAQMIKNMSSQIFAVFTGFSWFFAVFGPKPTIGISKICQKIRFSQNRFYACSDGKYDLKTCLRHQEDSFHAKYHHFESFKRLFKNSNFCQKCDFLGFFEIFDLWVIFRFFAQNRSKIILNACKSFSGSPNIFQIHWMILYDDLKTI